MVLFLVFKKISPGPWRSYYTVQEGEYVTQERVIDDNLALGHRVLKLTIDTDQPTWPATVEMLTE